MSVMLVPFATILGLVGLTVIGDYYIKLATYLSDPFRSWQFALGFICYAFGAFGWFYAMKHLPMAVTGVVYACLTIVMLALVGAYFFKEALSYRELFGITLAILAVLVVHDWSAMTGISTPAE